MTAAVPAPDTGQSADVDRTARSIKGDEPVRTPTLERRQGVITAVDVPNAKVDLTLGGNSVVIPGVAHLSNYRPTVGDTVWVDVNGPDLLVLDRVGAFGPSVISTAVSAFVTTQQTRSSTSYGDLSTVGPSAAVSISPSGRVLVQVSAWVSSAVAGDGGAMGISASGANSFSADDTEAEVVYIGTANSLVAASKVTLVTGLLPGTTTFKAVYKSLFGGSCRFELRHLWALPL